jgi:hypothetical protein
MEKVSARDKVLRNWAGFADGFIIPGSSLYQHYEIHFGDDGK